ncbi:ABC transporter ATP-binding protein [Cellulomonas shaoxiangyii]|uniref:ABC transporter ATP-binding protein n=1 Tax=Cellulomonas shaoxiangyii TaxID=2566013 RepID=UPI00140AFCA2|nr:ATP-binding cassette domain-containing protein [Cellulomonas shaoxiangyii]
MTPASGRRHRHLAPAPTGPLDAHVVVRRGAWTLDAVLGVPAGTVLAVLGPNGGGKSTAVAALAGLVPLDGGHVRLGDRTLAEAATGVDVPPERRRLGVVLQDVLLVPHLTARENVAFGRRAAGERAADARHHADRLLTSLAVDAHARTRAHRLSGGQAQRVALARALAVEPAALLLDEPFAALDAPGRATARDVVHRYVRTAGVPAVLVTHTLADALAVADDVAVVEHGRVVQRGAPRDVAAAPATAYVAGLVAALDARPGAAA